MESAPVESHFLRHVADLADKREVVARAPIRAPSGATLMDSGERFTRAHYDELAKHRLLPSVEETLVAEEMVNAAALRQAVEDLLDAEPAFAALAPDDAERQLLVRVFATLPLSAPLAFKLTVAREERPEVFDHGIKSAYCAAALARYCGLPHHEIVNAAAAGAFHDLGMLHVDPDLLRSTRSLTEQERHHVYSHPLTSYLILERDPIWHPVVSIAVLEHHERIDGSGYPQGLRGDKLGRLGQLVAVADVAATLLSQGGDAARDRLEVVLGMNEGKLNREYSNRLLSMFPPPEPGWEPPRQIGPTLALLVDLSVAFLRWQAIARQLPDSTLAGFVDKRMTRLAHSMADIGVDLEYWSAFNDDDFDAKSLAEMEAAAHEGVWQLRAIAAEVRRRWKNLLVGGEAITAATQEWLASIDTIRFE